MSGEVLGQMKQLYALTDSGSLIVTLLLDEPTGPLPFKQQLQPPVAVLMWDDGQDCGVGLRHVPGVGVGSAAEVFELGWRESRGIKHDRLASGGHPGLVVWWAHF